MPRGPVFWAGHVSCGLGMVQPLLTRKFGEICGFGNQQSSPEAALVEKLVNSVDARLISACREARIDPESARELDGNASNKAA